MQNVRNLLFVYALLHGTRFLGRARVIWARRGTCAGSAGVTAGRGSGARTCGALFMVPSFAAPVPALPWLAAPPVGCVVCPNAAGVARAKMQAEANRIFFIWSP